MNITAKVIADTAVNNQRVTTLELEYPRFIHSELMTHRVFSRNAASSRAIPIKKLIEQVEENTVMPIYTRNQKGMQGEVITNGRDIHLANCVWLKAMISAVEYAKDLDELGIHKQVANRILEPFQHIKTIVTATDWENFFTLRLHEDADPHIYALAKTMKEAMDASTVENAVNGYEELDFWHIPYIDNKTYEDIKEFIYGHQVTASKNDVLFIALLVSASCCAQVSYRTLDTDVGKAIRIGKQLLFSEPEHASPFEHQATANFSDYPLGNLRECHQARHVIKSMLEGCTPELQQIINKD